MAQGYTAVKVDPLGVTDQGKWVRSAEDGSWKLRGHLSPKVLDLACVRVAARRQAGGRTLDIINENHVFTDTNTAIQLAKAQASSWDASRECGTWNKQGKQPFRG